LHEQGLERIRPEFLEMPGMRLKLEQVQRGRPEYELLDTGVFDGHRYFDVQLAYA
jgi:hypothetical protein